MLNFEYMTLIERYPKAGIIWVWNELWTEVVLLIAQEEC